MSVRINDVAEFGHSIDPKVDCPSGLTIQRILSVPLRDQISGRVFGTFCRPRAPGAV